MRVRVAAALVPAIAVLVVLPGRASAADRDPDSGWWWSAQPSPGVLPAPPTVPAGGTRVSDALGGSDQSVAAFRIHPRADQTATAVVLHVASARGLDPKALSVLPISTPFADATSAGPWSARPVAAKGSPPLPLEVAADGSTVTVSLAVGVTAFVVQPSAESLASTSTDLDVAFSPVTADDVSTTPSSGQPASPAPEPAATAYPATAPTGEVPPAAGVAPPPPLVPGGTAGSPPAPAPAVVAPPQALPGTGAPRAAVAVVAGRRATGRTAALLGLLLSALYAMVAPGKRRHRVTLHSAPPAAGTPVPAARTGRRVTLYRPPAG